LQVVDSQDDSITGDTDSTAAAADAAHQHCVDLDDGLQDNLCKLWDMSMNAVSDDANCVSASMWQS